MLQTLLSEMEHTRASDLHLMAGSPPVLRVYGDLRPHDKFPPLTRDQIESMFHELVDEQGRKRFREDLELDLAFQKEGVARYRVNISLERGNVSLAVRRIPMEIPDLDQLGLPAVCHELAFLRQGLVLVTGPTGSGKSTTMAAMIDLVNETEARRIVTVEDPIEYVYVQKRSIITQRQVGQDTHSFALATKFALRQDPDIILVGEMRDSETMAACLTAAETGHLVMSTLHTNNGPQTIDRIVDSFPHHRQNQIRMQLSLTLQAVLSQLLLPRLDGGGRVPALEVMLANNAIRNLIREGKTHQMRSVIQTSRSAGMQTMEAALKDLYQADLISLETAREYADNRQDLQAILAS